MGIVINEIEAQETPCTCYALKSGSHLCYTKGVCGFLSGDQRQNFCRGTRIKTAPPALEKRLEEFSELSRQCSEHVAKYKKGTRLEPFLACMSLDGVDMK